MAFPEIIHTNSPQVVATEDPRVFHHFDGCPAKCSESLKKLSYVELADAAQAEGYDPGTITVANTPVCVDCRGPKGWPPNKCGAKVIVPSQEVIENARSASDMQNLATDGLAKVIPLPYGHRKNS